MYWGKKKRKTIDLTVKINFEMSLSQANDAVNTKYFCVCGKQISYRTYHRFGGVCVRCNLREREREAINQRIRFE